ncbi:uncharacterized protein LOC124936420 [Impatiens glandulifera]|uniref:uncharacterized protein LOC124936420 n=1 Tax=Impatiens glandulifera TaxID=253017 RepID=UPI001FB1589C|nr:uncharacterized protein LOC124936420 [Impatiens glandulifera]
MAEDGRTRELPVKSMAYTNPWRFTLFLHFTIFASILHFSVSMESGEGDRDGTIRSGILTGQRRGLMRFREIPSGSNVTFECSPSGPCIACQYSEKNDPKFRCSETGYRIPLKCVETRVNADNAKKKNSSKGRLTLQTNDVSKSSGAAEVYITYRSCIPAVNEEKLSVFGFESIMLGLLLLSGSVIYFRQKRSNNNNNSQPGISMVRIPSNSRF